MDFFKDILVKQRYPALLLLAGLAISFAGSYSISGKITEPQVQPQQPSFPLITVGLLFVFGSVLLFALDEDVVAYRRGCKISDTKHGFAARFRDSNLTVEFGLLQDLYNPSDVGSGIVLPANEFFDERCFSDERTVAGAIVRKYFSAQGARELKDLVHRELRDQGHDPIAVPGVSAKYSYGVGTCVYVGRPLGEPVEMIFAAVASDRPPNGLGVDLSTIFKVIEEIRCHLAGQRLTTAFVPLLGAGKGGVPAEIAFTTLLSAILEARCRDGGHHLEDVHVVIFQPKGGDPQVPLRKAKRALRQMVSLYQEMLR